MTRISDLDFTTVIGRVERFTLVTGQACDPRIQAELARMATITDRLTMLRAFTALAAVFDAASPDALGAGDPLVRALARVQSQLPSPIPAVALRSGTDAGPRLRELVAACTDAKWDIDALLADVVTAIRSHGDVEIDEAAHPWHTSWGAAQPAVFVLFLLVALRALGQLDTWEQGVHDAELEQFERTRHIRPSALVEEPPKKTDRES